MDERRPIHDQVSSSRPRAEVALLLVLTLGVGSLFAWRAQTEEPSNGGSSIRETFGALDQQLRCLKTVTEEAFAEAQQKATETSSPDLFDEIDPVGLDDVAVKVEEVRDLNFENIPEPTYLSLDALADRASGYAESYPDAEAIVDSELLSSLGAVPAGSDLKDLTATALSEQVAGFYDTETKEIVVSGDPEVGLDSIEEVTLAHELEHALADQVLGLPIEEDFPQEGAEDSVLAATALVEGDATLTMSLYSVEGAYLAPTTAILGAELAGASGLTALPHYLQRSMIFPYIEGLGFVCGLYMNGGWAKVNDAYANPPTTTAQVLFPERYADGEEAIDPRDSQPPGPGWTLTDVQAFGAADLLFLFEAPGDDTANALEEPLARAAAWGGGEVQLWAWRDGEDYATAILLVQKEGEQGLCDSVREWYRAAFPNDPQAQLEAGERLATTIPTTSASLRCEGNEVRLGIGLDLSTARRLVK
jgi:hypothetical protein